MSAAESSTGVRMIEQRIGVTFRDRSLLLRALTHRSWLNEHEEAGAADNERLEFLGDAVIDFVAAEYLFRELPEAREGDLTLLRSRIVDERALGDAGRRLGLGPYLRLGRGEDASGGRERPAILCDAFEALIGAVYLDRGLEEAASVALGQLAGQIADLLADDLPTSKDPKSAFQERVQGVWKDTPRYETVDESGPDHAKQFTVRVLVGDVGWATGTGRSKAMAAQAAARAALQRLLQGDLPSGMARIADGAVVPPKAGHTELT